MTAHQIKALRHCLGAFLFTGLKTGARARWACCKRIKASDRLASRRRCRSFAIAPASPTSDLDTDGSSKPLGDAIIECLAGVRLPQPASAIESRSDRQRCRKYRRAPLRRYVIACGERVARRALRSASNCSKQPCHQRLRVRPAMQASSFAAPAEMPARSARPGLAPRRLLQNRRPDALRYRPAPIPGLACLVVK